jgi:hypothetical protein
MEEIILLAFAVIASVLIFLYQVNRKKIIEDNRVVSPDRPAPVVRMPKSTLAVSEIYDDIVAQTMLSDEEIVVKFGENVEKTQMQKDMDARWSGEKQKKQDDIPDYKKRRSELAAQKSLLKDKKANQPSESERLRGMLKNPESMKDALILSEILSKPPHLDSEE